MRVPAFSSRVRRALGNLLVAGLLVVTSWGTAVARPDDETGAGPAPQPPPADAVRVASPSPAPARAVPLPAPTRVAPSPAPIRMIPAVDPARVAPSPVPIQVEPAPITSPSGVAPASPPPSPTEPVWGPAPVPSPAEGEDPVRSTAATRLPVSHAEVTVKLRDLARVQGVNSNPLVGYGLVVGLAGSGDSSSTLLAEMADRMFTGLGLNRGPQASAQVKLKNAAVVMVTSELPSTSAEGDHIDVTVSSIGDAASLEGGTLVLSSLKGADGQVYATAQGPVIVAPQPSGMGVTTKVVRTVATLPRSGLVVKASNSTLAAGGTLRWVLRENDFAVAERVAAAINRHYGTGMATALDNATVEVRSGGSGRSLVSLIGEMEELAIPLPPGAARVVVNERSGTVVMGGEVRLRPAAIAHGNMRIEIKGSGSSKPKQGVLAMGHGPTVEELVQSLNALGVSPRDLIAILQALRRASALQAEIITM